MRVFSLTTHQSHIICYSHFLLESTVLEIMDPNILFVAIASFPSFARNFSRFAQKYRVLFCCTYDGGILFLWGNIPPDGTLTTSTSSPFSSYCQKRCTGEDNLSAPTELEFLSTLQESTGVGYGAFPVSTIDTPTRFILEFSCV
jgi:hypothetical protein